jgi:two-component system, cell cycle sensor histidine kinase and response regulator CckA
MTDTDIKNDCRFFQERIVELETELKKKEALVQSLREHEKRFERLVENVNGMVYRCKNDSSWSMEYVSIGALPLTGYSPHQLIDNREIAFFDLVHAEDRKMVQEIIQKAVAAQREFRITYRIRDAKGNEKWVWEQGSAISDEHGIIIALEGYITDITNIKESENTYRSLFGNNHTIMFIIDPDNGAILDANPAACEFYGYACEALTRMNMSDVNVLSPDQVRAEMTAALSEQRNHFIFKHRLADGAVRDVEVYSGPIQIRGRKLLYSIIHDITERMQTEQALVESEEKFRMAFDASPDAVNVNRLHDGLYVNVNEGFTRLTGYARNEVIGKTSLEINIWEDSSDRKNLVLMLQEKGLYENLEARFKRKDGSHATALMSARLIYLNNEPHILSITRDMTELKQAQAVGKKLEDQLRQAQRLESIGRLAGGVAHDFNNILSIILGYSELLLGVKSGNSPESGMIGEIHHAAIRARDLTRQLLAFSRKQVLDIKPIDVTGVVTGFERLLRRVLGEDIELVLALSGNPLFVRADSVQLEQVLMNLTVNARDAMTDSGTLTIETTSVYLDDTYAQSKPGTKPGNYVMIGISDTGCGIEKEIQDRIFDPFFTTKSKEKGTGLGLATSYGIIKQHGGNIWVYSEPGQGTTFKIYLPICSTPPVHALKSIKDNEIVSASATILIVEDDKQVLRLAEGILKKAGYRVIISDSVENAIEQAGQYKDPVHLVLTDVVMPVMKGPEVFSRISEIHPEADVLYMSGYTENVIVRQGILKDGIAFIQKPFSVGGLLEKVQEVLLRNETGIDGTNVG